jgi:hypothetical protein
VLVENVSQNRLYTQGTKGHLGVMGIEKLLVDKREEILRIAARHGAFNVRVFGSVARGEARPGSDRVYHDLNHRSP